MRDAVIVDAVRTPIGKGKPDGALSEVHPVDLFAHSLRALVERTGVDPASDRRRHRRLVDQVGEQAVTSPGTPCSPPACPSRCPPPPSTASAGRRSRPSTSPPRA